MLSVAEATRRILDRARFLGTEEVSLAGARGRVLAASVRAERPLPPWDNSAMDGFAVRAADLAAGPVELPVAGEMVCGSRPGAELPAGAAFRIMTGAPMPAGADAVVMREEVDDRGASARFAGPVPPGEHVRRAGEDVAAGSLVLGPGTGLGPGEIGMLAALGRAVATVGRRPRVAILCTGDELCPVGGEPAPGQIFSSNEHALAAQVAEAGGEVARAELVPDDRARTSAAVAAALDCDVVVTSGGVSVGDRDHVRQALDAAGVAIDFWKVAMRPGKPVVFGTAATGALFFGLPGNPASSLVSFELFVRPALLALQGAVDVARPRTEVVLAGPAHKSPGRAHYLRAVLHRRGERLEAELHAKQGSGMLSSLVGFDALVELAAELGDLPAGARCPALLLRPA
ncbi:MAG TPA: gephyrin-like molybdotransferase Glp [Kofleriaceae bacterium]|nr:gephyrin-like molybdotransferase Glp [Kofleriaceae bacterium]